MRKIPSTVLLIISILISGCGQNSFSSVEPGVADLVIYTYQESAVYESIIKEYQERTDLTVRVIKGSYQELSDYLTLGTLPDDCDLIFGADTALLESFPSYWETYDNAANSFITNDFTSSSNLWTAFSAQPLVIMYNTKIVRSQERPVSWSSLLNPHTQGQIAFMSPVLYDAYACALVAALKTSDDPEDYVKKFADNINYTMIDSSSDLSSSIAEGSRSIGVATEEKALSLMANGADINYLHPQEYPCILVDGSAVVANCKNSQQAKSFIDFTVGKDVQSFLTSTIHRRSIRTDVSLSIDSDSFSDLSCTSVSLFSEYDEAIEIWAEIFPNDAKER